MNFVKIPCFSGEENDPKLTPFPINSKSVLITFIFDSRGQNIKYVRN